MRDDFEDAANRVVGFENRVHFRFHFLLRGGVGASQRRIQVRANGMNLLPGCGALQADVAYPNRVAGDFRAEFLQEKFRECAGSDARSGFPGRSALEDVTRIVIVEFQRAGKVGMPGTRRE